LNAAIDQVGCLPWDFPIPTKNGVAIDLEVCISQDAHWNNKLEEFHKAMKNRSNLQNCTCMTDCETVSYDVQVDNVPLLPAKQLCRDLVRY
jgi:hypothetical protein